MLQGRVAIVTGAGSGIGREIALTLAQAGAVVVVSDINDRSGAETVESITGTNGKAVYVRADTSARSKEAAEPCLSRRSGGSAGSSWSAACLAPRSGGCFL